MEINGSVKDIRLEEVIGEGSMKVQKLYRDGLQYTLNTSILDYKGTEATLNALNNLDEVNAKAKETERKFEEVMIKMMEEKKFPQYLHKLLQEQKNDAHSLLKHYDDIILKLNDDLNSKSSDYRQKIERQSMQHEEIRERIEKLVSELNRVGKEEIRVMRSAIVKHSKHVSDKFWGNNEAFFHETGADKPFDLYLWKRPSEMLTFQQLEKAFLVDQTETFKLRRSLLSEVCKLRNELEREKLNYNLKKQVFEQETFYLKENYYQNMPIVTKMKKRCIMLRDKRDGLRVELKSINEQIKEELKLKEELNVKLEHAMKLDESCSKSCYYSKYNKVFEDYNEKAKTLHSLILNEEKFIYEDIFQQPWKTPKSKNIALESIKSSEKKYWDDFLNFALKYSDVEEILQLMEEHRLNLKACSELAQLNDSLRFESREFKSLLKLYHKFIPSA